MTEFNNPLGNVQEIRQPGQQHPGFLKDLSIYLRDFLDTDFKKERKPKRKISRKDRENRLTAIGLKKYETFTHDLWEKLEQPVGGGFDIHVYRNRYTILLDAALADLIEKQIRAIDAHKLDEILYNLITKPKMALADKEFEHPEQMIQATLGLIEREIKTKLITPLLSSLDNNLQGQSIQGIEDLFDATQELVDIIIGQAEEAVVAAINTALVEGHFDEYETVINDLLAHDSVKSKLSDYFRNFNSADLYFELLDILNTVKQKENFQVYLYLSDIKFDGHRYPLIFIPLTLTHHEDYIDIQGVPHLYINKKAIDYIAQQIALNEGQRRASMIKQRIIYLLPENSVTKVAQKYISEWSSSLQIRPPLDLTNHLPQTSRSTKTVTTNELTIATFEKSEEAMLNDYETLLEMADGSDPVFLDFANIIGGFLHSEPQSFMHIIEDGWNEIPIEDRLVYESPVPLNAEQRKIASALGQTGCRFIAVQGPPGTGKSHTISAIAFDAILKGQSVLVLSDKTEALDVVEEKLTSTLNKVRGDDTFQNPLLRLGKTSNTYNKILTGSSIERIRQNYLVARTKEKEFSEEINQKKQNLKDKLVLAREKSESIDLQDVIAFEKVEAELEAKNPVFLKQDNLDEIADILFIINELRSTLTVKYQLFSKILHENTPKIDLDTLSQSLDIQPAIKILQDDNINTQAFSSLFNTFRMDQVEELASFIRRYEEIKMPVFGFFFVRSNARALDDEVARSLDCISSHDLHRKIDTLIRALNELGKIRGVLARTEKGAYFNQVYRQLIEEVCISSDTVTALHRSVFRIKDLLHKRRDALALISIHEDNVEDWLYRNDTDSDFELILEYLHRKASITDQFAQLPEIDYTGDKTELETLHAKKLANVIDERVINFYENHRSLAQSVKQIIKNKQQFPRDKFEYIKQAFPCIIANIRDYAEYVPLERDLFDIVIIDEASQVSIAQAFPAIIRSKILLVLGDQHQFSNVKTSQASKAINETYLNKIRERFLMAMANNVDTDVLSRLRLFDIKTSILTFVSAMANYSTMLKKHFRGYPELIDFSSEKFYEHQLQAVKLRGKAIEHVIEFTQVENDGRVSLRGNSNELEYQAILAELEALLEHDEPPSVGIITPFQDQQAYISRNLRQHARWRKFEEDLNLHVFTFDSCQGNERDVIMYSMVATKERDRLWAIFPRSIKQAGDIEEVLRLQRLNVGFSRAKEKVHFFISKPIEEFQGAIGESLRHFEQVLTVAKALPEADEVDPKSPMEAKLLQYFKQTRFAKEYAGCIELLPQFPIGDYLRQLDPTYQHPDYKVDFLLKVFGDEDHIYNIIIEYDGFKEHFSHLEQVDAENFRSYYKAEDIEREKVLESYGYHMIRVNRFNLGSDPIETLSSRLYRMIRGMMKEKGSNHVLEGMSQMQKDLAEGRIKKCPKCGELKPIKDFRDPSTKTGKTRHCSACRKRR
jgi:superfamily I DNA and/or RNA helicase